MASSWRFVKCSACGCFLTLTQLSYIAGDFIDSTPCRRCGLPVKMESADVVLSKDSVRRSRRPESFDWFHATTTEDWLPKMVFEGVESVHIGTKQAATDRVHGLFVDGDDIVYLNKVRIRKGLEFIPGIFEDDNSVECENDGLPRRYTNRWESPGSLSIAINPLDLVLGAGPSRTPQHLQRGDESDGYARRRLTGMSWHPDFRNVTVL